MKFGNTILKVNVIQKGTQVQIVIFVTKNLVEVI